MKDFGIVSELQQQSHAFAGHCSSFHVEKQNPIINIKCQTHFLGQINSHFI